MTIVQRKPRPLKRDTDTLRDDRLFIIACDDTYAPKQYFDFFKIHKIQIHVIPTEDGTSVASHVLERLLQTEHLDDDELWLVLDTDHCASGSHLASFTEALARARKCGVNVALSKPCFEFWLLLHHLDERSLSHIPNASAVSQALRGCLGEFNKAQLKREHFPLSSVRVAAERARDIDRQVTGGDIPSSNTTRIYRIWDSIREKLSPHQLPEELR